MEAVMTLPAGAPAKPKMKKGTVIALAGGAVALIGGFFVFVYKDKDGNTLWAKWTGGGAKDESEQKEEEIKSDTTPLPMKSGFPLNANEKNTNVRALQQALIKKGFTISGAPSDYLGANTIKAIKSAGYDVPVDKPTFDKILQPAPVATKKTVDDFKGTWVKAHVPTKLYYISGNTLFKEIPAGKDIGRIGKSLGSGWYKIDDRSDDKSFSGIKTTGSALKWALKIPQ